MATTGFQSRRIDGGNYKEGKGPAHSDFVEIVIRSRERIKRARRKRSERSVGSERTTAGHDHEEDNGHKARRKTEV